MGDFVQTREESVVSKSLLVYPPTSRHEICIQKAHSYGQAHNNSTSSQNTKSPLLRPSTLQKTMEVEFVNNLHSFVLYYMKYEANNTSQNME